MPVWTLFCKPNRAGPGAQAEGNYLTMLVQSVWVAFSIDRALQTLIELRRVRQRPPPLSRLFRYDKDYLLLGIMRFSGVVVSLPS